MIENIRQFEISFNFQRINYNGYCHEFQAIKVPQIYVILRTLAKYGTAFTFYKIAPDELFWYETNNATFDDIAVVIANTLLGNEPDEKEVEPSIPLKQSGRKFPVLKQRELTANEKKSV